MAELVYRTPGGFLPSTYYKFTVRGEWEKKLFGEVVRNGQDLYKMARLLDRRRFRHVPKHSILDVVLRTRAKERWFEVDYDYKSGCFFGRSSLKLPTLEADSRALSREDDGTLYTPSIYRANHRYDILTHLLSVQDRQEIWYKKAARKGSPMPHPQEIRDFTDLVGFKSISCLCFNPKDLMAFVRNVRRDELWCAEPCDFDFRAIWDEHGVPISYTDFRVPRGTILGQGFRVKGDQMATSFAVVIESPEGV